MIEKQSHDAVTVLRMRHGKANQMDVAFSRALVEALGEAERSPARAVILTGSGSIFSAGVDLFGLSQGSPADVRDLLAALDAGVRALFCFPKPTLAAINGHAIAGGCLLASACDLRLMARGKARIGIPELLVGVPFPTLGFEVMRAVLPPQHYQAMLYTGSCLEPEPALERGLVDELVEPQALEERALEAAGRLASLPQDAFRISKRQMRQPVLDAVERHGALLDAEITALWCSEEARERVRAYLASLKK